MHEFGADALAQLLFFGFFKTRLVRKPRKLLLKHAVEKMLEIFDRGPGL